MGYYTVFKITVKAGSNDRRLAIARKILELAIKSGREKEIIDSAVDNNETGTYDFEFVESWYTSRSDIQKMMYCGQLEENESLDVMGFGDNDDDVWRIHVSKRKFSIEYCADIKWIHKQPYCEAFDEYDDQPSKDEIDGNDDDTRCQGCQGCAVRYPIFK